MNVYAGVETVEEPAFSADQIKEAVSNLPENSGDSTGNADNALGGIPDKIGEIIGSVSGKAANSRAQLAETFESLPTLPDSLGEFPLAQSDTAQSEVTETEAASDSTEPAA